MFGGTFDGVPLRRGLLTGAVAFLGGSALVFLFLQLAGGGAALLSSALPIGTATFGYSMLHAWPVLSNGSAALLVLATIPAAILIGSGYVLATKTSGGTASGARRGAGIVSGYLAITVLSLAYLYARIFAMAGSMGTTAPATAGASFGAADVVGILLIVSFTGVLFPVLFGGIGGYVAEWRGH